ncbi:hypothetical protein LWF15_30755 [Kineosporia rhizophila]|uniref:hypothetical protein n=1 Tax=Kineosporia rhizophila TaxID=84633 RepID=UPI001E376800|nr:hypothetical protein [Kineosporia rhizophila]MCE0539885.1 hypothetical protein [Kineosporia rhizophila]
MAEPQNAALALLDAARTALGAQSPFPPDRRARAAAAMARTVLEGEIDRWLAALGRPYGAGPHGPGFRGASKLIALRALDGTPASRQVTYAWNALSRACHHHAYDLPASAAEVHHLVLIVEARVRARLAPGPAIAEPPTVAVVAAGHAAGR